MRTPACSSGSVCWRSVQSWLASRIRAATSDQSGRTRASPRQPVGAVHLGDQVGRPDHQLGGGAAPERALPADQRLVDPDDVEPGLGQLAGGVLPARAEAQHHHVTVLCRLPALMAPANHSAPRCVGEPPLPTRAAGRRPGRRRRRPGRLRLRRAAPRRPPRHVPASARPRRPRPPSRRSTRRTGTSVQGAVPPRPGAGAVRGVRALAAHQGARRGDRRLPRRARRRHREGAARRHRAGGRGARRGGGLPRRRARPVRADRQHHDGARPDVRRPRPRPRRRGADHDARLLLDRGQPAAAAPAHRRDASSR